MSVIILLAGMLFCFGCVAEADFQFPNGLTSIEAEAFCGDESITGLIQIPKSVDTVGKDAFSGTGLYALVVSESVDYLDQQNLSAAYVRFEGQTRTAGLAGVDYVIAPASSPAAVWASQSDDMPWFPEEAVTAQGGFLYLVGEEGSTLLSAVNGETVGAQAEIPDLVGGKPVTAVMPFAFARIPQLEQVSLPGSMKEACGEALSTAYPGLQIDWREGQGLRILQIRANRSAGSTQNTVTWTVETNDDSAVNSYDYTLRMGDEVIETAAGSESAEFTATLPQAGAYQLQVVAVAFDGSSATGTSALYVAEEIMRMILPQTLSGGADLEIAIQPVEGAYSYGVFVFEEGTGRYIASRTVTEAESVTIPGYLLEEGNYRVSGYVYGNLFRYAVPTVKTVTVAGERPAAPGVEKIADEEYGRCTFALTGGNYDLAAVRVRSTNGGERTEVREVTENQIYCYAEPGDTVSFSCRGNGVWSSWGEGLTVEMKQLDKPLISLDAESYPSTGNVYSPIVFNHDQLMEMSYFSKYNNTFRYGVTFFDLPAETEFNQIISFPGLSTIFFEYGCTGNITFPEFPVGKSMGINLNASGVTINVTGPTEPNESGITISATAGTAYVSGNIKNLYLYSTAIMNVQGNISELNIDGEGTYSPYTGSLWMNGTVGKATVYGSATVSIPNVGEVVSGRTEIKSIEEETAFTNEYVVNEGVLSTRFTSKFAEVDTDNLHYRLEADFDWDDDGKRQS